MELRLDPDLQDSEKNLCATNKYTANHFEKDCIYNIDS